MLETFHIPIGWTELFKRTAREMMADNTLNLAAQLAYYFFLALFPALLFLVAIVSYVPIENLMDNITQTLSRVAPGEVITIMRDQLTKIANNPNGGLLTIGMLGTIWSTSSGVSAIMDTLNQAYDIQEGRPWWKTKSVAIGLTLALGVFVVVSFVLVVAGPILATHLAERFDLGTAFELTWKIAQWPVVFVLIATAVGLIYYYAPDAEQDWVWITPGSLLATALWILISLGFKFYVSNFGSYNATYGTIGGVIVLMLWFYVSSLAVLAGAELNAEIEHASPYGKDPGEKVPGEKKKIGIRAARAWRQQQAGGGVVQPSISPRNCDVDDDLQPASAPPPRPRASDWILSGVVLGELALLTYGKLRRRFKKVA